MNALATGDPDLFDLHYGDLHDRAASPPAVRYVSFTDGRDATAAEMSHAMDADVVDAAVEEITFTDLSRPYFRRIPVPRDWYAGGTRRVTDLAHAGTARAYSRRSAPP